MCKFYLSPVLALPNLEWFLYNTDTLISLSVSHTIHILISALLKCHHGSPLLAGMSSYFWVRLTMYVAIWLQIPSFSSEYFLSFFLVSMWSQNLEYTENPFSFSLAYTISCAKNVFFIFHSVLFYLQDSIQLSLSGDDGPMKLQHRIC